MLIATFRGHHFWLVFHQRTPLVLFTEFWEPIKLISVMSRDLHFHDFDVFWRLMLFDCTVGELLIGVQFSKGKSGNFSNFSHRKSGNDFYRLQNHQKVTEIDPEIDAPSNNTYRNFEVELTLNLSFLKINNLAINFLRLFFVEWAYFLPSLKWDFRKTTLLQKISWFLAFVFKVL